MHVEGLLPANLCLVSLLSSEQCSQFERFCLQPVQMVNKTSSFKTKLIVNNVEASQLTIIRFDVSLSQILDKILDSLYKLLPG